MRNTSSPATRSASASAKRSCRRRQLRRNRCPVEFGMPSPGSVVGCTATRSRARRPLSHQSTRSGRPLTLDSIRERLDGMPAADRIDGVGDAAFVQDDLLVRSAIVTLSSVGRDAPHPANCSARLSTRRETLLAPEGRRGRCLDVRLLGRKRAARRLSAWIRSCCARGLVAPNRSRMSRAQRRRAARNFAISSMKSLCALKSEIRRPTASASSHCPAAFTDSHPCASDATSRTAVAPASRM